MLLRAFTRLLLGAGALDGENLLIAVGLDLMSFHVNGSYFGGH